MTNRVDIGQDKLVLKMDRINRQSDREKQMSRSLRSRPASQPECVSRPKKGESDVMISIALCGAAGRGCESSSERSSISLIHRLE